MELTEKCKLLAEAIATRRSVWADGVIYSVESLAWTPGCVRVKLRDNGRSVRDVEVGLIDPSFEATIEICPFCGGPGKIEAGSYAQQWYARCIHCDTKTKVYDLFEDAIAAWNRRA